jgi:hypothetical protein
MSEFDSAERHNVERAQFAAEAPTILSQDHARQGPIGHRVVYVLGFGVAGAIVANTTVFLYFVSFYAAG